MRTKIPLMRTMMGRGISAPPDVDPVPSEIVEDKELVLAFKRGEDGSYQAIYERYSPRVSGICRRMLDHSHDAEEAQQETFMRVYTALPKFNGRYQLGAWVSRIATNVCLDQIRSKGRKPADSASPEMLVDLSVDREENGPEEQLLQSDEREKVRQVLSKMAPSHRAALALREFEGMSYLDIAVALNMTEPQVKALIHRARKSFKREWSSGLAALLPWRFIARMRRLSTHYDAPPQVSEAAASAMHVASSCSMALQQCGQFVSERAATAMTALVVGTAAIGVAVSPSSGAIPEPSFSDERVVIRSSDQTDTPRKETRVASRSTKEAVAPPIEQEEVASEAPPPAEEAEPTTQPTTAPAPEPTSAPAEATPAGPKGPVGPAPVETYFGWTSTDAIPRAEASSSSLSADCSALTASHEVQSTISLGSSSYPVTMSLEIFPSTARLSFTVQKDAREYFYLSWGPDPVTTWTRDGAKARVEISGEYGPRYGSQPATANLPESGTFHATLTLDCAAQVVVTEGAAFSAV